MKIDLRKTLLAGTAIVAVGAFVTPGAAQAQTAVSLGANGTWSSAGTNADDGTIAEAEAGANVDITADGVTLTVTNDGTADDSGGVNAFTIGTITDSSTAEDGALTVQSGAGADLTVGITAATLDGNVLVQNQDANNSTVATNVTNNLTVGGTLNVTNTDTSAADTVTLDVGGDLAVTGATTLTAAAGTGSDATANLNVFGDATFTGGLILNDDAGGALATLTLDGTSGQTVDGTIVGNDANEGVIAITNTNSTTGVVFDDGIGQGGAANVIDTITVNNDTNDQRVEFEAAVTTANGITLGGGANADTVTAVFDSSAGSYTVTGAIAGGAAGDTVALVVNGGNTVTQATASTANLDTLNVTGSSTILDSGANLTVDAITIGSGATLDSSAGTLTAAGGISLSGTLQATGGAITANVTGASGTIDVDANTTITGAVSNVTTVDVATGTSLTMVGALGATTTTLNGTGDLDITAGNNLTGNVVTDTDGNGTITVTNGGGATSAISGNIGTSSAAIGTMTFTASADMDTVTTDGNLFVDAISLGQADTLSFLGSTQSVSGTVGASNDTGAGIVIGNGTTITPTVTFNGVIGGGNNIDSLTVNDNSTGIFNANATFDAALSADNGTLQVDNGVTLTTATQTDGDTVQFNVVVNKTAGTQNSGLYVHSGDAFVVTNDTVNFVVKANSQPLTAGASVLDNVFVGNANANITGTTVTDNSFIYDFTLVADNANNAIDVTITETNSIAETSTTSGNSAAGTVLLSGLSGSTDGEINEIQGLLQAAGTANEVNEILEAVQPAVDGGNVAGALTVANTSSNITAGRLAALRTGDAATGMTTGNVAQGLRAWVQGFGASAEQDQRDNIDGFESDTYGIAAGVDTENMFQDTVVGLAFSYADTDVDSDAANNATTEIDSYQLTLYGDHDFDNHVFLSGMLAYGHHDNDTRRNPTANLTANGSFDANQYTARATLGREYQVDHTKLTPTVMGHWTQYDPDSYTETGAGGANLTVDGDEVNIFELGVGLEASWEHQNHDGSIVEPEVRVGYRYDFADDAVQATSTFAAGGASFTSTGFDPAQSTFNAGAGLTYYTIDNWEFTANYDFEIKEDYDSHSGFARLGYKF